MLLLCLVEGKYILYSILFYFKTCFGIQEALHGPGQRAIQGQPSPHQALPSGLEPTTLTSLQPYYWPYVYCLVIYNNIEDIARSVPALNIVPVIITGH